MVGQILSSQYYYQGPQASVHMYGNIYCDNSIILSERLGS